jgi:hypothetical protein
MKIIQKEFNVQTGKETITERDETPEEETSRLEAEAVLIAKQAEAATKTAARQVIFDRLNLTAEEAQLLLKGN